MANKKIKVTESCIITKDDKGKLSLVANAKEALTTLSKNNVDVYILLKETSKDDAAKLLKDNDVAYKELMTKEDFKDKEEPKFDACVVGENNIVQLTYGWRSALDSLINILYGKNNSAQQESEQEKMDNSYKRYKHYAEEANKANKNTSVSF